MSADVLITNVTVVNWMPRTITLGQAVLIQGETITAVGETTALEALHPDAVVRDGRGKLLLPGNICAHTHFYGAFARGMAIPGAPPRDFPEILQRLWWALDKALTPEDVKYSALVCLVDAIRHGTTSLIDHHASPNAIDGSLDLIADAVEQAGLRAVLCYEVTDRDGEEKARAGIAENVRFLKTASNRKRIAATFGLHASLTLSHTTLDACRKANEPFGGGFHIHLAEHESDEEDSLRRSGVRATRRLAHHHILSPRSIVAHAVHVDAWEMELLRETETWVTHQPRSNMNNGVGVAALDEMMRGGIKLALGNDGFSNFMFDEWKTAYLLHKVANRDPRAANGELIAQIGAVHNAELIELFFPGTEIGVIEPGAEADLILLDYQPFTPLTTGNLPWHVIFGVESSMVTATICGGEVLMWDRQLLTLDVEQITTEARVRAPHTWARYGQYVGA